MLEEWLCLGEFPLLKDISIFKCSELKRALPQHLPSLQKLEIRDCNKLEASIPKCDNMIELDIRRCDRILVNELPTSLKKLVLSENQYTEFSVEPNLVNYTILDELNLDWSGFVKCPSLDLCCYNSLGDLSIKGWHSSSLPLELHLFTKLHYLYLYDCPELESFPMGGLPSNLRSLKIYNCPKLIGSREEWGLFQLSSLLEFSVSDEFENVESFPEENLLPPTLMFLHLYKCSKLRKMNNKGFLHLKSLKSLSINNCPSLENLLEEALHLFTKLDFLYLVDCPELDSFPEGGLPPNLSSFGIYNCPKLIGSREEWGLFQLNSLKSFFVTDEFENVESFPEENLLPSTLETLYVENCSKLRIMNNKGFLHLKSLKAMRIFSCPSLERLPEKEALPNSLDELWIDDCLIIKEKYEKEGGERWHTICHIPRVLIDGIRPE
ncbi:NBS-LRR type disease resistance protein [Medicago truncatula]|uniref:NBS-LRR type disease resistance protein n=3 Tax=Medicago truncatula TaxID=3880 RepID=G7J1K5_MEDTR|nr:NBS-LRR type disease resistance protein [Medicago truncatula]